MIKIYEDFYNINQFYARSNWLTLKVDRVERLEIVVIKMRIYLYSDLGDVVFNAIGDATKRNSRFDGLSVSSNEMIASVMLRFNGGFVLIIFLLNTFVCSP